MLSRAKQNVCYKPQTRHDKLKNRNQTVNIKRTTRPDDTITDKDLYATERETKDANQ